jgi:hypothetical protein
MDIDQIIVAVRQVVGLGKRLADLEAGGAGSATDHATLTHRDYASAGHTGFMPTTAFNGISGITKGTSPPTDTDHLWIQTA